MHLHYDEAGSHKGTPVVMLHGGGPGASGMSNFKNNLPVFVCRQPKKPLKEVWPNVKCYSC